MLGAALIPAGTFFMGGSDPDLNPLDGEGPVREVHVNEFWIAKAPVTNAEFARFVAETGYVSVAEDYGWSFVFHAFLPPQLAQDAPRPADTPWWRAVEGATWRSPEGPGSGIEGRENHPAVHLGYRDAAAYAQWAGGRLPTEAEWEKAARGGLKRKRYAWGNTLMPEGRHMCNIFQGTFPDHNTEADGFAGTSPVGAFPENGYGLVDVAGNVWEWTSTEFTRNHATPALLPLEATASGGCCAAERKRADGDRATVGPHVDGQTSARRGAGHTTVHDETAAQGDEAPPQGAVSATPGTSARPRAIRGGSYLCHDSYCNRYRVAARTQADLESTSGNMGMRVAWDADSGTRPRP